MPTLTLETHDSEKPIILISGENPLIIPLVKNLETEFKIALVSDNEKVKASTVRNDNIYRIKTASAYLVKNLEEKIDYAALFLNDERQKKYLPHVIEKLVHDRAKIIIVIDTEHLNEFEDFVNEYKNTSSVSFALLGDVYSEKRAVKSGFNVTNLIIRAMNEKKVILTGNDLTPIFPIYYEDAIVALNQLLLGPKSPHKFCCLYYSNPQTIISAVHILRRAEPELEIQYEEKVEEASSRLSHEQLEAFVKTKFSGSMLYLDKYFEGFEKSVLRFVNYDLPNIDEVEEETSPIIPARISNVVNKKETRIISKAILFSILGYLAISVLFLVGAILNFKSAVTAFKNEDYKTSSKSIKQATFLLNAIEPNIQIATLGLSLIKSNDLSMIIDNFSRSSGLLSITSNDLDSLEKIQKGIDLNTLNNLLSDAFYLYFTAEKLKMITPNDTLNTIVTPDLTKVISVSQVAEKILGYGGERNYLILFQNNGELRPTGGFIGSVGELKITEGRVISFDIRDVYDYDGALKNHIEPYYIIRRFIQPHLYLRDSNFDPDFQNSASAAAGLYHLETGKKVDGVIAINYEAVKEIIKELGPIKLTTYNKTIDDKNAFEFLESTIDNNFFPGSTQKKDVLTALFNQVSLKLEDHNNFVKVARLLPKIADEKNILFAFNETSTQAIFSAVGYGDDFQDNRTVDNQTIPDFLFINEANIGANKANVQVTRNTSYQASITPQGVNSKALHTLINGSSNLDYSVYLRIIVPAGSKLDSVKIDGQAQDVIPAVTDSLTYESKSFKAPAGLEVDNSLVEGHQVFGLRTIVPHSKTQTIEVNYKNGVSIPSSPIVNYSLKFVKQPGVSTIPLDLVVAYPDNYSPQEVEGASLNNGNIQIKRNIKWDEDFSVRFISK